MTIRILLTGIRSPVGLTLVNNLTANGYEVYCADSCKYPLVRYSKNSKGYFILPSPRFQPDLFKERLIEICHDYEIDLLIPLCEEIFYISRIINELPQRTEVFCDRFELLVACHNKKDILNLAEGLPIQRPESELLTADTSFAQIQNKVIKKVYSRFGSACYKQITRAQWEQLPRTNDWLVQEFISGAEYCSYSIAFQGELLAHTAYAPKHRLYDSASIYFDPVEDQGIFDFCKAFIKKYNFTGQIAFDFIRNQKGLFLIECNPRATSGLFLLAHHDLATIFVNKKAINPSPIPPQMLKIAMLTHGFVDAIKQNRLNEWQKDLVAGQDVLQSKLCQLKAGTRVLIVMIVMLSLFMSGKHFRKQTTEDIEYPPLI